MLSTTHGLTLDSDGVGMIHGCTVRVGPTDVRGVGEHVDGHTTEVFMTASGTVVATSAMSIPEM